MKLKLTKKDIQLLKFLSKYKMMLAKDAKRIYVSKDYHYKRLKKLENEKYIKRISRYIKLDINGIKLMKELSYDYQNVCRNLEYQDRLKDVVKIATLTIASPIEFVNSLEMKDSSIFTQTNRKFIGELTYQGKKAITYYISKGRGNLYIRQVINDIQKVDNNKNIIIFIEDMKILNKSNQYFIFGKQSTVIIKATSRNLEMMRLFQELDFYEILKQIYSEKEILLSNWKKADYMTNEKEYIILMPFIDTEKLHRLNSFYNNNQSTNRKIDIVTLKENKIKIEEILANKTNIIELNNLIIGGRNGEK